MAFAQFHKLVGVARIAVSEAELAAPVRIQAPLKRHAGPGSVEQAAGFHLEIPDYPFGFQYFALRRKFRDSDQARQGRIAEQHPFNIRLLFAYVKPVI
jgi:hypothetical protein